MLLAALSATSCVGPNLDIAFSENADNSRFVMLPAQSPIECGVIGEVLRKGRVPPLLSDKPTERILLELQLEGFKDEETIELVRLNIDPATVGEAVLKLPAPIKAWRFTSEGEIEETSPEVITDLSNLYLVTAPSCSDRVAKACRGVIECPQHEVVLDEEVPKLVYAPRAASAGSGAVIVSGGRALWVDAGGVTELQHPAPVVAACSRRAGGVYLLDADRCIWEALQNELPKVVSCNPISQPLTGADIAEGPDGRLWIAQISEGFTVDAGVWQQIYQTETDLFYDLQIVPLDKTSYLFNYEHLDGSTLLWGKGERSDEIEELQPRMIAAEGDDVVALPLDTNDPHIYRINIAQSLAEQDLVISRQFVDLPTPLHIITTEEGPVIATVVGTLHNLSSRDCPYPKVERIPYAMTAIDNGLVIVGDDISDFTNQIEADTRVYVIRTTPIEDCRSAK